MYESGLKAARAATPVGAALDRTLHSWDGLIERLPIGVYSCDRDGVLARYNTRAAELWGQSPPTGDATFRFSGAVCVYGTDGVRLTPSDMPMAEVLASGQPVRDREVVIERPDGGRIHVLANVDPLFDEDGVMVGAVNCFQDISAVRRAESGERGGERRARDLLDALPVAVYTTDVEGRITYFNEAAADLAGRRPTLGLDKWCVTWRLYGTDGAPLAHDECPMALALKENRAVRGVEAVAERPDGVRVPFMPFPSPLHDESGALIGAVNMLVDISDQKDAEARQKQLVDELNHRVKNTLSSVQSIARHTAGQAINLDGFNPVFEARLMALSRAHDLLTNACWTGARLFDVLAQSLAPYGAEDRTLISGEDIELDPRMALALSMALHELADNAARHGALSAPAGRLDIVAHRAEGKAGMTLDWVESGGPDVLAPSKRGFGLRLIQSIVTSDLDGAADMRFPADGMHCAIAFPLPAHIVLQ